VVSVGLDGGEAQFAGAVWSRAWLAVRKGRKVVAGDVLGSTSPDG
jgi:hypothetical protein